MYMHWSHHLEILIGSQGRKTLHKIRFFVQTDNRSSNKPKFSVCVYKVVLESLDLAILQKVPCVFFLVEYYRIKDFRSKRS